jgi:hypothetical protein
MKSNDATPGLIRNVQQSVQYRDVTKQAQDVVVYIDGQSILVNPYLGEKGVAVPFNDYVTAFQASYDVDHMVPTGALSLSVPIQQGYLFRSPGGNHVLNTMAHVRVYMKGAYLSPRGNTVYRQVFSGFITSIGYTQDGKFVNIALSLSGAMGYLERMQIDMSPGDMSSSPMEVTPFSNTNWNLNPYQMIAWVFLYGSMIDGFEMYSIRQAKMDATNPYYEAVESNYVAKWQAILYDLARDVHIFGAPDVDNVIRAISSNVKNPDSSKTPYNKDAQAIARDLIGKISESQDAVDNKDYYTKIRGYMPDMSMGNIQLLNGRVTSRLERLRYIISLIGFEAYQDMDGSIIIKPPIYNLDVTVVGSTDSSQGAPSLVDGYDSNNPFVIELSEILSEQENEDEGAVRLTRLTAHGSLNPAWHFNGTNHFLATSEDIDLPKLAQFGLRSEPPMDASWFKDGDTKGIYAFVASELARANRGFRTYSVTIPSRPELKIGFPIFFPHKDVYGYVKNITIGHTQGGASNMTVTCDSIRRRPMFPTTQNVPQANGTKKSTVILTPQDNLVLRWSKPGTAPPATQSDANLAGRIATLPTPTQLVFEQEIQMMDYRKNKIGNSYGTESDLTTHCWRVQPDEHDKFDGAPRQIDSQYMEDLRSTRPYTDGKGYELIGPFPWGRWKSLRDAIYDFTISDVLGADGKGGSTSTLNPNIHPNTSTVTSVSGINAFLFAGDATPAPGTDTATQILDAMQAEDTAIANNKVIELTYNAPNMPISIAGIQSLSEDQAGAVDLQAFTTNQALLEARTASFLFADATPSTAALQILSRITPESFSGLNTPPSTGVSATDIYKITPEYSKVGQ